MRAKVNGKDEKMDKTVVSNMLLLNFSDYSFFDKKYSAFEICLKTEKYIANRATFLFVGNLNNLAEN